MNKSIVKQYSPNEEIANVITHAVGAILAVTALVVLVVIASHYGDAWKITSASIYGISMISLYTASTLYHLFKKPRTKKILNTLDHISIYYLIAGSYTPFMLINMRGAWGWTIFGIIWALAITGTILKLVYGDKLRKFSNIIYIAMGWIIIIAIKPLIDSVDTVGLILLLTGGLFYTFGVIFYKWKSLPYNHAIWHMFVLGGTVTQFFAILFYVILPQ